MKKNKEDKEKEDILYCFKYKCKRCPKDKECEEKQKQQVKLKK